MSKDAPFNLFLDDVRNPNDVPVLSKFNVTASSMTIARTSADAQDLIVIAGRCPDFISFDHDLAFEHYGVTDNYNPDGITKESDVATGYDFAKWLVYKDIELRGKFIPDNFRFYVHSMNPVGAENIRKLLSSYLAYRKENVCNCD
jgi:hypothetical protein